MGKIIDIFSYHNEVDLLKLRLNILDQYVDEFIIVEAPTTFSGAEKPFYFEEHKDLFSKWLHKIKYYKITENYTEQEIIQAGNSPNTRGEIRWMHEFLQKEQLKKSMTHLDDEDVCYVGDVDEIWTPEDIGDEVKKLNLRVYTYYLNMRSTEEFWGTIQTRYKNIKSACLNHLRNGSPERNTIEYRGWHFTSQGGLGAVMKKVTDQYNEVFSPLVKAAVPQRFGIQDYIGRDFKFKVDESEWPQYLKDNKEKYSHLCKN